MQLIEFISQPWHWSISGFMIAFIMFLLIYLGQRFGVSSSFQAMCSIGGAGNFMSPEPVQISAATISDLEAIGVNVPKTNAEGMGYIPHDLFNFEMLGSLKGILLMVVGGFLIGFGTRYAGGCTSGHAITGLSNLQIPSLVAVIGFFIGGLLTTFFILPFILSL